MKLAMMRSLDAGDPLPLPGERAKASEPVPVPQPDKEVRPGVFQGSDGKLYTEIKENEKANHVRQEEFQDWLLIKAEAMLRHTIERMQAERLVFDAAKGIGAAFSCRPVAADSTFDSLMYYPRDERVFAALHHVPRP